MDAPNKKLLSKIPFIGLFVVIFVVSFLYLYNIIRWGNFPDRGFYFRTATGVSIVGIVKEPGHKAWLEVGDIVSVLNSKNFSNEDICKRPSWCMSGYLKD